MNVGFCVWPRCHLPMKIEMDYKEDEERHGGIDNALGREMGQEETREYENKEMREILEKWLEKCFIHQCITESKSKPWLSVDWGRRFTRFIRNVREE